MIRTDAERQAMYKEKNMPGPGVIGEVPKLAQGAVNPMWATQAGLEAIAARVVPILKATETKRQRERMVSVSGQGQYLIKKQKVLDNPEDVVG